MNSFTPMHPPSHNRVQRFRFTSFGEEEETSGPAVAIPAPQEPVSAAVPVVPENRITQEEVNLARAEGREQGYREGYEAARSKAGNDATALEEEIRSALAVIANRITLAAEEYTASVERRREVMQKTVMAIARKVAGEAMKASPYAGVEELVAECVGLMAGEMKIVITVAPRLAVGLRQRVGSLKPMLSGFEGEIAVEEDNALVEGDCRVEWKSGYAERDTARLWNDIEQIINRTSLPRT